VVVVAVWGSIVVVVAVGVEIGIEVVVLVVVMCTAKIGAVAR